MSLYNNVIRNVQREEKDDEEKLGYEFWNKVENAPVIKQIGNYFQENNERRAAYDAYARSKENDNLLTKGLSWTAYGLEKTVSAPFQLIDMGLEEISDRTNIDKRSLKLGLDLAIASRGVKGSKTGAYNKGVYTRQGINKQYNKLANIFKKPENQLIDIKSTRVFDDVAGLSINDSQIAGLLNPIFTAKELGLDPTGTTFYSIDKGGADLDLGFPGKARKGEPYEAYFNRMLNQYGAKVDSSGYLTMSSEAFHSIKNSSIRREIAQMILTDLNQGVKGSFLQQKRIKNPKLDKDLANYNKKYGARADLHHGYPSVIGIDFYLDIPYMGEQWKARQAIAAKYGNVPGQPMVDGKDNLVSLPSSIPSTITDRKTKIKRDNPAYVEAKEGLEKVGRKIPQHLHQIIHDSFLTNEMGQSGKKFWERWNPIIDAEGEAGWLKAYEDFNEIIARNRTLYKEALSQLDVLFGTGPLSANPEKLTDMLEEYIGTGKVLVGSGNIRDKEGNIVMQPGTLGPKVAEYSQDAVKYNLEDTFLKFKQDAKEEILGKKYEQVKEEIEIYPQLTKTDVDKAEDLLYNIKWYNSILFKNGARRANHVTKITKDQHKQNMKDYYDIIQLQIFRLPRDATEYQLKMKIQTSVFKGTKVNIGKQLEFILDE